jgi:hypothetical protein
METFHEGTRVWGDASSDGKQMNADLRLRVSLARFVRDVPIEKIFYIQLYDIERFDPPYSARHPWALAGEAKTVYVVETCEAFSVGEGIGWVFACCADC